MLRSAKERAAIRRRFRVLRVQAELNQLDTALAARMAYGRYLLVERGYELPTDAERAALARVFKVDPEQVSPLVVEREAVAS